VHSGAEHNISITLSGSGTTCETFYDSSVNKWYVISTFGTVLFS
jgi:hypothetical protein